MVIRSATFPLVPELTPYQRMFEHIPLASFLLAKSGHIDALFQRHVLAHSERQVYLRLYAGICNRVGGGEYEFRSPVVG